MARIVSKRVLEDIRFRSDVVEIIGTYINVKRAGSSFKALCPFHKEKTPSFHVNPQRQIYHCFGCGAGGDVFGFIMQYEGVDFTTAVKMLADRAGITVELEEGASGEAARKQVLYKVLEEASRFYQRCLLQMKTAAVARDYLAGRDLSPETLDEFVVGYAPDMWDAILKWGQKNKYGDDLLDEAGLVVKSSKPRPGSEFYDRFRNRIMFPIRDQQNRVIGFSGRTLEESDKSAKYVNSPEGPLFQKSRVLYALEKARHKIVEEREAIVCEGQVDVIRCHQSGFETAVASQGTAFTEDHARILKRYADSVVIVFDPDRAGEDAAIRTAMVFMDSGLAVRVAILPPKEDPDSFIRNKGAEAFRSILDKARSAVGYQVEVLSARENIETEVGLMRVAKGVLGTIGHSPNAVQRAKLVQEASEHLNLPASALLEDLRHMMRQARRQEAGAARRQAEAAGPGDDKRPSEETELCEHLVNVVDCPEIGDLVEEYLPLDMLSDAMCRTVVKASLESAAQGSTLQEALGKDDTPAPELQKFAARVQMAPLKVVGEDYSRADAVKALILRIWRREMKKKRDQLGNDEPEKRSQITRDLHSLKSWDTGSAIIRLELGE